MDINDVEIKLGNLRAEMYNVFDELKIKQETDIIEANNQCHAYYHNLIKELSALSSDVESIKLNLKK